jgi:Homeodomain-like domain
MGRRLRLEPHLAGDELERRYRAAQEPHERSWWQILWLWGKGQTAAAVAESTGYSRYWIGQLVRRYNTEGPEAMRNRRYTHSHRPAPLLSPALLAELADAVRGPAPAGEHWLGRTVAEWMSQKLGRPISVYLGWAYLVRLDGKRRKRRKPRPRHVQADAAEQAACKKSSVRSSGKSRPPSPTPASSSGRSTSIGSA